MKQKVSVNLGSILLVAPPEGAWIETPNILRMYLNGRVAPHEGAWIETFGC